FDEIQIDEEFKFRIDDDTELCAIAGYFSVTFRGVKLQLCCPLVLKTLRLIGNKPFSFFQNESAVPEVKRCHVDSSHIPTLRNPRWLMVEITLDGVTHKYEFN
ncbi:hypothetical protein Ocin01_15822, partial [Orchesella cincta]